MRRYRNLAGWTIAAAATVVAAAVVWAVVGIRSTTDQLLGRGPAAPAPSARDAAAIPLTPSGVRLTIKQRSSAWLPGGKLKLHLDDITGKQVIVSVTDDSDRVTVAPKSVKQGDRFSVRGMDIEVIRLENLLVGSGDFGEFDVTPKP